MIMTMMMMLVEVLSAAMKTMVLADVMQAGCWQV